MSTSSKTDNEATQSLGGEQEKKKLKPCCACPETRKPRDECILENGEEACKDLIEAHKECLRKHGFKV